MPAAAKAVAGALAVVVSLIGTAPGTTATAAPAAPPAPDPVHAPVAAAPAPAVRLPALVADGLAEESHSRYVYDGRTQTVRVTVSTTIRNAKPDVGLRYWYWNRHGIPVPRSAQDVRATSGGSGLTVAYESTEDPGTKWAMASFAPLLYGQTRSIQWSYTIAGEPIRSKGYTRVGKGYATFMTQAVGDPGAVSVEVDVPREMEFTSVNASFSEKRSGDRTVWTAREVTDGYGIWSPVSLRNAGASDKTKVKVGGQELTLLSFPGDTRWTAFAKATLRKGLPVVEKTIGQDWPGGLKEIREDVSPEVVGFAWYDTRHEEIVVDEDLDEQLFLHELTHTWVNGDSVEGRWLVEGLTEAVARRVVRQLGGKVDEQDVARDADAAVALADWGGFTDFRDVDHARERYAYAAAPATVEKLVAGLDDKQFADLVSALLDGESAYLDTTERTLKPADWRRLLDLIEDRTDVQDAQKILAKWVLTDKQKAELPARAKEREQYLAYDEADGAWTPPEGLRFRMTTWDFKEAAAERKALADVPGAARRVQDAAAAGGFPAPSALQEMYETATLTYEYAVLRETIPRAAGITERVSDVVRRVGATGDPFTELGETVLGVRAGADAAVRDLDAGRLTDADEGAARTAQLAGLALWVGIGVVLLALGAVLLVVLLIRGGRRRRRVAASVPPVPPVPPAAGVPRELEEVPGS
ncbi:hypothetical protein [Myceligenerans crystallogenes]|uniref:Peptidase MA superfamily protein n=1 Tax=Myceligenerans crystallogenes TaxID=316335 RepID=A0ABP5A0N7_9MICO